MNFPKFMIRQTGGFAVGAISTKSRLASFAFWSASAIGTTPSGSPPSPIRRTSLHRIWSLIRSVCFSILHLRRELTTLLRARLARGVRERVARHRSRVSPVPQPDRDQAGRRFLLTDDEHRGDLLELRLANARAELLISCVHFDPQPGAGQPLRGGARRRGEAVGHWQHDRLDGRDPERKVARRVLDQDPEEALHRSEDRAVEHDRTVGFAVLADVGEIEEVRLGKVNLHRSQLPWTPDRVLHPEVDLGTVEVAVLRAHAVRTTERLERRGEDGLRLVPVLVRADSLVRPGSERDINVVELESPVDVVQEVDERRDLRLDLVDRAVD